MHILNVMFGRGRGGLEQAAVDYHEALSREGHHLCSVTHPNAAMNPALEALPGTHRRLTQFGEWDGLASARLRHLARRESADMVIAHGNRAIGLALQGLSGHIPVVGVAHNYQIRRFPRCDASFSVTRDLMEEMVHLNIPRQQLHHIPNMIRLPEAGRRQAFRDPPVIGTLGRLVDKKGFDIFLQSIAALHEQGMPVRAIIGGYGPLAATLQQQAHRYGLAEHVRFTGWVEDKAAFFDALDIFVLPSRHEPFGIVLIEAMAASLPCITTDTEGPCEIIRHEKDAVMIEKDRPYAMAQAIKQLIDQPERAFDMAAAAHVKARERYSIAVVAPQLHQAVSRVLQLAKQTSDTV